MFSWNTLQLRHNPRVWISNALFCRAIRPTRDNRSQQWCCWISESGEPQRLLSELCFTLGCLSTAHTHMLGAAEWAGGEGPPNRYAPASNREHDIANVQIDTCIQTLCMITGIHRYTDWHKHKKCTPTHWAHVIYQCYLTWCFSILFFESMFKYHFCYFQNNSSLTSILRYHTIQFFWSQTSKHPEHFSPHHYFWYVMGTAGVWQPAQKTKMHVTSVDL